MFETKRARIQFEIFAFAILIFLFITTIISKFVYQFIYSPATQTLIDTEIGKFFSLGIFITYVAISYFTILRKYDFLMTDWRRRNAKNQIEHQTIIDCCLPAWKKLQIFIIACFILGLLFLDPLDAGLAVVCCEIIHIIFRAAA